MALWERTPAPLRTPVWWRLGRGRRYAKQTPGETRFAAGIDTRHKIRRMLHMACYNANTGSYVTLLTCLSDNPTRGHELIAPLSPLPQVPRHRLHNIASIK